MSTEDDVNRVRKVVQALNGKEERVPVELESKITLSDDQIRDAIALYIGKKIFPHIPHFWFRAKFIADNSGYAKAEVLFVGYSKSRASEEQGAKDLNEAARKLK